MRADEYHQNAQDWLPFSSPHLINCALITCSNYAKSMFCVSLVEHFNSTQLKTTNTNSDCLHETDFHAIKNHLLLDKPRRHTINQRIQCFLSMKCMCKCWFQMFPSNKIDITGLFCSEATSRSSELLSDSPQNTPLNITALKSWASNLYRPGRTQR